MVKIKWKSIYYPLGEWVYENGYKCDIKGNFRCKVDGVKCIVVMKSVTTPSGHGEPSMTSDQPTAIREDTLEVVDIKDKFVDVEF